MNLLYAMTRAGRYPTAGNAATATFQHTLTQPKGDQRADVLHQWVAAYTGLSAVLAFWHKGGAPAAGAGSRKRSVWALAHRAANGGQLGSGSGWNKGRLGK